MSRGMRFPTMWYVQSAKPQISLRIWAVWSEPLLVARIFYEFKATDWTSFGVSELKRGCTSLSESTLVKMPHCWKSHAVALMAYMISQFHFLMNLLKYFQVVQAAQAVRVIVRVYTVASVYNRTISLWRIVTLLRKP